MLRCYTLIIVYFNVYMCHKSVAHIHYGMGIFVVCGINNCMDNSISMLWLHTEAPVSIDAMWLYTAKCVSTLCGPLELSLYVIFICYMALSTVITCCLAVPVGFLLCNRAEDC